MGDILGAILGPIVGGIASMFTDKPHAPAQPKRTMQWVAPTGGKSYTNIGGYGSKMDDDQETEKLKNAFSPNSSMPGQMPGMGGY